MNKKTSQTIKTQIPKSHFGKQVSVKSVPRPDLGNKWGWQYRVWEKLGQFLYIITWPGIWLVVWFTPPRTRVIVEYNGKILLTKDWLGSGDWNLPGGGLHKNETEITGAARELYEETGILLESKNLMYLTTALSSGAMSTQLLFYKVKLNAEPDIRLQKFEILDYIWVDSKMIHTICINRTCRDVVVSFVT